MSDVVIRKADKGGATVALDRALYRKENCNMLSDTDTYKQLLYNPTEQFEKSLEMLVSEGVDINVFTKRQAEYILTECPVTAVFHSFPNYTNRVFHRSFAPLLRELC